MEAKDADAPFPTRDLMPKNVTQAEEFLEAHPEWDGRGVIIAVLDTGVDPGAPGLQVTPDGRPKMLDIIECSGSGDVDMSKVVKAEADGTVTGVSGRTLKLNGSWVNPSGEFRLGLKEGFDLFPNGLKNRYKKDQKKVFDAKQAALEADLVKEIEAFDAEHKSPKGEFKAIREDLETRLQELRSLNKSFEESGPMYDCVMWNDGSNWRVAIDDAGKGDLAKVDGLAPFGVEHKYASFNVRGELLNYGVQVYDEGKTLSIVTNAGSHASHVAGIAAGYHPDDPDMNGIAPGAQVISMQIGDGRLGSMETGTGLQRGLLECVRLGVDIINLSYGEPCIDMTGRFIELADKVVFKHGIVFCSSAGNAGPALTTVGAPAGCSDSIIGVGAMVTPDMAKAEYSIRESGAPINYTWSSRGPCADGAAGVSVSAPGAAITGVPRWTQQKYMLMNGTSMSCPNTTGNISLLLSAMKAQGKPVTPQMIRWAIENSAVPVAGSDVFGLGKGLLQTARAYDMLVGPLAKSYPRLVVKANSPFLSGKGVYIREYHHSLANTGAMVSVSPSFHEDTSSEEKADWTMKATLVSTADWVEVPGHVMLMNGGRSFVANVNQEVLERGVAHYAEIRGYDSENLAAGPLFRIPVTVIRPEVPELDASGALVYDHPTTSGTIRRRFFATPEWASWADFTVTRVDDGISTGNLSRLIVTHGLQVKPQVSEKYTVKETYSRLRPGESNTTKMALTPGLTLELAIAQFWSVAGDTNLRVRVQFGGASGVLTPVHMQSSDAFAQVVIRAAISGTKLSPSATLTHHVTTLHPKSDSIGTSGERDVLPDGRQLYSLVLSYDLKLAEKSTISAYAPRVVKLLYESPFDSQLVLIHDASNRLVGTSDAFPETLTLDEGSYTVRLQVRHSSTSLLEDMKTAPMHIKTKLSKPINCSVYASRASAVSKGTKLRTGAVADGHSETLFITPPESSAIPSSAAPGDSLTGSVKYVKLVTESPSDPPSGADFVVHVASKAKGKSGKAGSSSGSTEAVSDAEAAQAALRKAQIELLKVYPESERPELYRSLKATKNDLPLASAWLDCVDKDWLSANPADVEEAADAVIEFVHADAQGALFREDAGALERKEKETKVAKDAKDALVDALFRKSRVNISAAGFRKAGDGEAKSEGAEDGFEGTVSELARWVDLGSSKYAILAVERDLRRNHLGAALKRISKALSGGAQTYSGISRRKWSSLRLSVLSKLGWDAWVDHFSTWEVRQFPASAPLF